MIFRNVDGSLIEIKRNSFKNDKIFYTKLIEIKVKKEIKQQNVHSAFMVKESSKTRLYSKQAINKLMQDFS
jgi:hypothetical protein